MSLGARLAKLEEKAAIVIRCAWCRVSLVDDHAQKARGREVSADYVMRSCTLCGNKFKVPLHSLTPKLREVFLLWAYTHSGETYRDERAYAAEQWWTFRMWVRVLSEPVFRQTVADRHRQKQKAAEKPDAYTRERAELKAEADRLMKAEARRQRREYGPRTFPLVDTLRQLKEGLKGLERPAYSFAPGPRISDEERDARRLLIYARCMEACELALWGAVEETTAAVIEARAAEVAAFDEARAEAAAAQEREAAERLRQEDERRAERERTAREGCWDAPVRTPGTQTTKPPRSRFRKDPAAPSLITLWSSTRRPRTSPRGASRRAWPPSPPSPPSSPQGNATTEARIGTATRVTEQDSAIPCKVLGRPRRHITEWQTTRLRPGRRRPHSPTGGL